MPLSTHTKANENPAGAARWAALAATAVLLAASCSDDGATVTTIAPTESSAAPADSAAVSTTSAGSTANAADAADSAAETTTAPEPAAETEPAITTDTVTTAETTTTTEASASTETAESAGDDAASQNAGGDAASAEADDGDSEAVMDIWSVVFDSSADFSAKLNHLEGGASLEASNAAYAATGERMGGISLRPTDANIAGDVATVTYDVLFGGKAAYRDLSGAVERVDGSWIVSRDTYCGFLASARTPCEQ